MSVASKATSISISSQTAGSTIRPASYNGIFAMKPSFGLIPRTGVLKTSDTLDTVSFFGSNLSDLEYTLRDLTVRGPNYPNSAFCEYYSNLKIPKSKKLKIGIPVSYLDDLISEDIKENKKRLIAKLKKYGHQIKLININNLIKDAHWVHDKIYSKSVSYYFKEEFNKSSHLLKKYFEFYSRWSKSYF